MSETTFKVGDEVTYTVVRSSGSSVEMNTRRGKIRAFGESGRCALVQSANGRKQWLALSRLRAGGARTELTETVESMFSADDEAHRERRLRSLERAEVRRILSKLDDVGRAEVVCRHYMAMAQLAVGTMDIIGMLRAGHTAPELKEMISANLTTIVDTHGDALGIGLEWDDVQSKATALS